MSAALIVQKALRNRFIADNVLEATKILDRHERPAPSPSIIIGEGQIIDGNDLARAQQFVTHDLHVWKKEQNLVGANAIAGDIRKAINRARLELDSGWHCINVFVRNTRSMRDPDGKTSHVVVTVETLVLELDQ
jgi:hypothetical protein